MQTLQALFDALEPSDQSSFLAFIEFLQWKRYERPEIRQSEGMKQASEQATRLRAVRETLGKTLQEAADATGVALATYAKFETRGPRRWTCHKVKAYCEAWGVNEEWLMTGTGTMFGGARPQTGALTLSTPRRPAPSRAVPASNVIDWRSAQARKRPRENNAPA